MLDVFIPTYRDDLPQLSVLLRSLDTHLDPNVVRSLNVGLICPASDRGELSGLDTLSFASCTRYFTAGDLGIPDPDGSRHQGWNLQQVAKLNFARHATTSFYLVLDSKNIALRSVGPSDLVQNGKAAMVLESAQIHANYWRGACWALKHRRFDMHRERLALSAATPVLIHALSAREMIDWLEKQHRTNLTEFFLRPRPIRSRFMRITEFSLYHVYMDRERRLDQFHYSSQELHDVPSQIWSDQAPDIRTERLRRLLSRTETGLFTGIQRVAWRMLTDEQKDAIRAIAAGRVPISRDQTS